MVFGILSDDPMSMDSLTSLVIGMFGTVMATYSLSRFKIRSTEVMGAMAVCCLCSCSSSGLLGNDIRKRFLE
jgi:ABC-type glycerol-3-phosphate transport system permease component